MQLIFESLIAGLKFHQITKVDPPPTMGMNLKLEPEPSNPYDANAIKVLLPFNGVDYMLGYIPKVMTHRVHPLLIDGSEKLITLSYVDLSNKSKLFAMVAIYGEHPITIDEDESVDKVDQAPEIDL